MIALFRPVREMAVICKRTAARLVKKLGWDIRPYDIHHSEWLRLQRTAEVTQVTTVLDVGANAGQFASKLRSVGFAGRIISFEPLSEAHAELQLKSQNDANWTVVPRMALAGHDGIAAINVARNSVSSSLLPMRQAHLDADPNSGYVAVEEIQCARLDSIAADYIRPEERILLKLDVQGTEAEVLCGATGILNQVVCIRVEISLSPLYEGQHTYHQMIELLESMGYVLWALEPGFTDRNTGRMLQVDATFVRQQGREKSDHWPSNGAACD